jgi:hypothetical protein
LDNRRFDTITGSCRLISAVHKEGNTMNLNLDVNEINFVLQTLGNLPSSSGVWPLIVKIKEQAEAQLPQEAPAEE